MNLQEFAEMAGVIVSPDPDRPGMFTLKTEKSPNVTYIEFRCVNHALVRWLERSVGKDLSKAILKLLKFETIPEDVLYNEEAYNFYHAITKRGMGNKFYQKWFNRRKEFPQCDSFGNLI